MSGLRCLIGTLLGTLILCRVMHSVLQGFLIGHPLLPWVVECFLFDSRRCVLSISLESHADWAATQSLHCALAQVLRPQLRPIRGTRIGALHYQSHTGAFSSFPTPSHQVSMTQFISVSRMMRCYRLPAADQVDFTESRSSHQLALIQPLHSALTCAAPAAVSSSSRSAPAAPAPGSRSSYTGTPSTINASSGSANAASTLRHCLAAM